jgi:integrase
MPFIRLFILIALYTGMRTQEIRMLRWKQVGWDQRELVVGRCQNGNWPATADPAQTLAYKPRSGCT